jgi:hypothetical protein
MNNATTLLLQHSVREHVADQMRCFFFYRDSLSVMQRDVEICLMSVLEPDTIREGA